MNTTTTVDREARAAQRLLHFIHMIRGRNICGICDLHFVTRVDLNEHMQQHVGISYTCDCCKVICNTWLGFQEHWLIHRHMVFCPYCYKVHTNYWRLNLHWRMHGKKISLAAKNFCFKSNVSYNRSAFAYRTVRMRFMLRYIQDAVRFEESSFLVAPRDTIQFTVLSTSGGKRRVEL